MPWLEVFGWIGSVLVVVSLTLSNLRRFRTVNLVGSVIATAYNAVLGIWPFVAMNAAIAVINVYWLVRLHRERFVTRAYRTVPARLQDGYVQHLLGRHAQEIARFYPGFDASAGEEGRLVHLVVTGDQPAGLVVLRRTGPDTAEVELDYVSRAYRDYTPGAFVYRDSGVLAAAGLRRVRLPEGACSDPDYFRRVGFRPGPEGGLVLDVAQESPAAS